MASRITILSEHITNKIAAGEVVERPASVVKELVENALDSGASDVYVEIEAGGRRLIRVTDNGHGMSREDALLSLERHATSKIRDDSDLAVISTLGFRGEALPSIASVSRLRLTSREPESIEGTEIIVDGGKVRDVRSCGMAPGTELSVEHLFFNTPARLKFLRNAATEAGHVGDLLARMAISRPEVSFTLVNDGKEVVRARKEALLQRLTRFMGNAPATALHPLAFEDDGIRIAGYISGPAESRSGASAMFTYVNGRYVRDRVIQHAIMQACREVFEKGRYPLLALFLEIAPYDVDVNVHPTKHEVRFRRQKTVHDAIHEAVAETLRSSPWLRRQAQQTPAATAPPPAQAYRERIAAAAQASLVMPRRIPTYTPAHSGLGGSAPLSPFHTPEEPASVRESSEPFRAETTVPEAHGYFSSLKIIGQFHREYILCQAENELVIIDQHAASERVAYQHLRRQCQASGVESQRLLFPETLELSFSEAAAAQRFQSDLGQIGFELEPFGGTTVIVTAVPRMTAGSSDTFLVRDILAELGQLGASSAFREKRDELLARIACHSVIRGVRLLEQRQITELLRSMDETDFAATCPHGRPVSHVITLAELEKIFKRT